MDIRLDQLPDPHGEGPDSGPFKWQEEITVSDEEFHSPDADIPGRIACHGTIRSISSGFLLEALLSYEQNLTCTRCLTTVVRPIESRIDLFLRIEMHETEDGNDEPELELGQDDLGVLVLPTPLLATRPLIAEQLEIDLPMKILCRDDCAGLCKQCGAELNLGPCDCAPDVDPRWGALAQLKRS